MLRDADSSSIRYISLDRLCGAFASKMRTTEDEYNYRGMSDRDLAFLRDTAAKAHADLSKMIVKATKAHTDPPRRYYREETDPNGTVWVNFQKPRGVRQ